MITRTLINVTSHILTAIQILTLLRVGTIVKQEIAKVGKTKIE